MRTLTRGMKLVVASHNKGKVWEINQLIGPYGLEAVSAGSLGLEEPEETEPTFEGNARLKAIAAAKAANLPALADDSGLEVECLGGAPGIYSARWAGPQKDFGVAMEKVAHEITARHGWAAPGPRANFISVLCLAWPDGETRTFEGKVYGRLVWPPRGGNGFGYDPMFAPDGHNTTFGEMEPADKYAISHRTRAFDAFRKAVLRDLSADPVRPNADRDAAGLHAAAANISTREELKTFVKSLSADLERRGQPRVNLGTLMVALEDSVGEKTDEPRWRTLAKALLAATEAKQP
jgi:XTP/dITP diphosphohydrolase